MRRHLTYANVAATLALVFAMSGGAFAAKHYLVESTGQINPKVIKKLRGHNGRTGKTGATGKAGATGTPGAAGAPGATGPAGPFPTTLPTGKTLTGTYALGGSGEAIAGQDDISFSYALAARPAIHIIAPGAPTPGGCTGDAEHPGAASGNLCVFEGLLLNVKPGGTNNYDPSNAEGKNDRSALTGIILFARGTAAGEFTDAGTWAVTG